MSLVITLFVPEGIVMASDSRSTWRWSEMDAGGEVVPHAAPGSDTRQKIFDVQGRIALGTFGSAAVEGSSMGGHISQLIAGLPQEVLISDIPKMLLRSFDGTGARPESKFYVAGYQDESGQRTQHVYLVDIHADRYQRLNVARGQPFFGSNWGGDIETMQRLIHPIGLKSRDGWREVNSAPIPYAAFTLQDAVDFCEFAIRTTIDLMRFQRRLQTVGGSIDIVLIQPETGVEWIRRRELK